jgi:hypothetical protein
MMDVMGRHELKIRQGLLIGVMKKLPPFDMKWSDEEKQLWWEAYHESVEAMLFLAQEEDKLEAFERAETERLYKLIKS